MRERVEDLGRLAEKLEQIINEDVFELIYTAGASRTKDFEECCRYLDDERQLEMLNDFAYGLDNIKELLVECRDIALGQDQLNMNQ